jgi:hypothetical protein
MLSTGWIQFLLVVVPVLSLIGSWLALRAVADRRARSRAGKPYDDTRFGVEGE